MKAVSPFPKIKNMRWLSDEFPDLIVVKIVMQNRAQFEAGLEKPDEQLENFYLDLSKLAGVKAWYEKGSETPSEKECLCDFTGIDQALLYITIEQMLEAWTFYKSYTKNSLPSKK